MKLTQNAELKLSWPSFWDTSYAERLVLGQVNPNVRNIIYSIKVTRNAPNELCQRRFENSHSIDPGMVKF